ncbi:MAG: DUF4153 domain-containing protein [Phaeovulum sp.]|uniref:DUF4153 domain-containing protein n=1 Tax=Phaeovulum sp. TaxID=2934796 RepID=UPI0027371F24|nr:DUF4153 domain-containing protein [Phaeovulum sp.]MDP3861094.1 DUF4153 domain-containing protein [Phaeovulum sp.]
MLKDRVLHVLLGTAGGLSGWLLAEILADRLPDRVLLVLAVLAVVGFGGALTMLAELGLRAALFAAAVLAPPVAALAFWGAGRFASVAEFFGSGHVVLALAVLGAVPVPFLMARLAGGRWGWFDYATLFTHSWNALVRIASAAAFAGVVWVVLLLSSVLLDLVGVTHLGEALRQPLVAWLLTGGALGLGLAVVAELADLLSPYLLLRLLRLLVPVVLAVVAVFVVVLPLRGLSELFGNLSAAAVLMAAAAGSVALISIAVDQADDEAVTGWFLPESARILAVLVPILGALSVWAVVLRVGQYGWTPGRVSAAAGAGVSFGYGVFYAYAVLLGTGWMERIRRANLAMALALIGLAALWLTPLLNAEAISVRSQMARFDAGESGHGALPLWEFAHDWGRPGQAALAELRARASEPGQEALAARLAALDAATSDWQFAQSAAAPDATLARSAEVPVLPAGQSMPEGLWQALDTGARQAVLEGCRRATPEGAPGCLLVLADLVMAWPGDEAVFLFGAGPVALAGAAQSYRQDGAGWQAAGDLRLLGDAPGISAAAAIDRLHAEGVKLVPAGIFALDIGGLPVLLRP